MESIFSQTHQDWELIVCDSYSEDGTWEYLQQFRHDPRVQLHQVPKEGLYAGWNECLRRAIGEHVYIATADDTCEPTLLTTLVEALQAHPEQRIAACECFEIDENGHKRNTTQPLYERILTDLIDSSCFTTTPLFEISMMALCGVTWGSVTRLLFHRDVFDHVGLYTTHRGISGDFDWNLRAAQFSGVVHVREPLSTWRIHAGQASNLWSMEYCKIYFDIFNDFLTSNKAHIEDSFGWSSHELETVRMIAFRRYEQDVGWVASDLLHSPSRFFIRMAKLFRMDSSMFIQRLLSACRSPSWNADPKYGLPRSLCHSLRVPLPSKSTFSRA
jgi:glycosyltransferase involved in cell wall biosynthesis